MYVTLRMYSIYAYYMCVHKRVCHAHMLAWMPQGPQPARSIFVFTVPGSIVLNVSAGGFPYRN